MTTNDVHAVAANNSEIPDDADLRDVLDVFKTMSDPTRMRIILAIAQGPIDTVHNEIGKGLTADYQGHTYTVGKPQRFTHAPALFRQRAMALGQQGKTVIFVAVDDCV